MENPNRFWIRLTVVFVGIIAVVVLGRMAMLPESWGKYGYYRGDSIEEEAQRAMKYGTNESCKGCHSEVSELKSHSAHQRLSCEMCHAPVSEHAKGSNKFAVMPTKKGKEQIGLCLSCHQKTIGRPEKFPMIDHARHLAAQKVKPSHTCDQCHTVHAPLENINHVKDQRSLKEALNEN